MGQKHPQARAGEKLYGDEEQFPSTAESATDAIIFAELIPWLSLDRSGSYHDEGTNVTRGLLIGERSFLLGTG